jgi:hypothetical protein
MQRRDDRAQWPLSLGSFVRSALLREEREPTSAAGHPRSVWIEREASTELVGSARQVVQPLAAGPCRSRPHALVFDDDGDAAGLSLHEDGGPG